jgi:hypothetical protein
MSLTFAQFLAIVLTALALVPPGAHLLALPNKIHLPQERYLMVQQVYRGWAFLGVLPVAAAIANGWVAALVLQWRLPFFYSVTATLCLFGTLAIFFAWTLPANIATDNWVSKTPNWTALRRQWEYSHAANALITLVALCLSILTALYPR